MTYLLTISIGPVQEFIAAARRTADLQAGSELLTKVAESVAESVQASGGKLIFPAKAHIEGANKILAELEGDPATISATAKAKAQDYLRQEWKEVFDALTPGMQSKVDTYLAEEQIATFLEFYAAWVPLKADYRESRQEADRLLAGRKALREFEPAPQCPGYPKSPLDPSRDCVIQTDTGFVVPPVCQKHPLWLKSRETLDAISLLKRVKGVLNKENSTPSTALMAARAFLPKARQIAPDTVAELEELAKRAGSGVDLGDLLYSGRFEEYCKEEAVSDEKKSHILALRSCLAKVLGGGELNPHYAILVADGDRMGEKLEKMDSAKQHRDFSQNLADFANGVKEIVNKAEGHLIYAGGDDVLALLPVTTAIACADSLAKAFKSKMTGTLSAGIAIVHFLEPLQNSIDEARKVEKEAKKERNSLAVALHTRGGSPLTVSLSWECKPDETWKVLIKEFSGKMARGFPYELQALAREFRNLDLPKERFVERLQNETLRILKRKRGGEALESEMSKRIRAIGSAKELDTLADQCVIARFLAGAGEENV